MSLVLKRKLLAALIVPAFGIAAAGLANAQTSSDSTSATGAASGQQSSDKGDAMSQGQAGTTGTGAPTTGTTGTGSPTTGADAGTSATGTTGTSATGASGAGTTAAGTSSPSAGGASSAASPSGTTGRESDRVFDQLDTNKDGMLTREEFSRAVIQPR